MTASKKEVEESVIKVATYLGCDATAYTILLRTSYLPKVVEMIAYEMFVSECSPWTEKDCGIYFYYALLLEYAKELKKNGWVTFNEKP